jgi:hypothetical protein
MEELKNLLKILVFFFLPIASAIASGASFSSHHFFGTGLFFLSVISTYKAHGYFISHSLENQRAYMHRMYGIPK